MGKDEGVNLQDKKDERIDNFLREIQKFLNKSGFSYLSLIEFLDSQKDYLLRKDMIDSIEACSYNALWDTVLDVERYFKFAEDPCWRLATEFPVQKAFDSNFKLRGIATKI